MTTVYTCNLSARSLCGLLGGNVDLLPLALAALLFVHHEHLLVVVNLRREVGAASEAWRAVVVVELWATSRNSGDAVLPPARVQVLGGVQMLPVPALARGPGPGLAASLWPPLVLVLVLVLAASPSKRPRVPPFRAMQPLVLVLAQPLAVASTLALGLQGPSVSQCLGSRHRCALTTDGH